MYSQKPAANCVGTVTAFGVGSEITESVLFTLNGTVNWEEWAAEMPIPQSLPDGLLQTDTVLLGHELANPVEVAQRVHQLDKTIPVLILSVPHRIADLKRRIMFSPFLGNEVKPWSTSDLAQLPSALVSSIERRQQRSSYLGTIESAQKHLGKLSLFQPEVTHYLDHLLDCAPVGVLSVDPYGTILHINRRAEAIFGAAEREILGTPVNAFFADTEQVRFANFLSRVNAQSEPASPMVFEVTTRLGEPGYVEATVSHLAYHAGQRGAMLLLQDVTQRVRAERERACAEMDLRAAVTILSVFHRISSAPNMAFTEKLDQLLRFGCRHLDLPVGIVSHIDENSLVVVAAVSPNGSIKPRDRLVLSNTYCDLARKLVDPLSVESAHGEQTEGRLTYGGMQIESYLGARVVVRGLVFGTIWFGGPVARSIPFTSTDREALKLFAQWVGGELQREHDEAHMRMLSGALEQAAESVVLTDRNGTIEYVNMAFEQLTGFGSEEVVGCKTSVSHSGVQDDAFYENMWGLVKSGEVFRGVLVNRRKDGSMYHEDKTITPLRDRNGEITHFISTGHDITEKTRAEEAARRHQNEMAHVARLSTLGEMASGLAHELTQPLCAITTYAQTCLRIVNCGEAVPEQIKYGLEQVIKQAELGSAIFRRLRNFARKGETARHAMRVSKVIREAVSLIGSELAHNEVKLRMESGGWSPIVKVDPIQIEQVIMNLVRNSMDAMSEVDPKRRRLLIRTMRCGTSQVEVSIADHGRGCPSDVVERLFEPFFTTKPSGLGIGLGISQTIIEAHGGRLWLESNSINGATFSFTLPLDEVQSHETENQ